MIFGEGTSGEAIDSKKLEEICGYKISMNLCDIFIVYMNIWFELRGMWNYNVLYKYIYIY